MLLSLRFFGVPELSVYRRGREAMIAAATQFAEIRRAVEGRRAIARMNAHMLSDIGLSHGEALHEVNRKPWDIRPIADRNR